MSIRINHLKKKISFSEKNIVLFSNDKFQISSLKNHLSNSEFQYINDILKTSDLKKNILVFELNSKKKIILLSIKNNLKLSDIENLGGEFYSRINTGKNADYFIISDSLSSKHEKFLAYFLHGIKLKSYEFKKYKTKKDLRNISLNVIGNKNKVSSQHLLRF